MGWNFLILPNRSPKYPMNAPTLAAAFILPVISNSLRICPLSQKHHHPIPIQSNMFIIFARWGAWNIPCFFLFGNLQPGDSTTKERRNWSTQTWQRNPDHSPWTRPSTSGDSSTCCSDGIAWHGMARHGCQLPKKWLLHATDFFITTFMY